MLFCPTCRSLYGSPRAKCGRDDTPLTEETSDALTGLALDDRYQLAERLNAGAMGVIYRARHAVLDHQYAVKILFGEYACQPSLVERFRREARAISQVHHDNIVSVIDFGVTKQGLVYLVMELVEGRSLCDAIDHEAPFGAAWVARIARQVASALGEAHRAGFVHRDVKPANIMLTGPSGQEQVKLLDFGLVGIVEQSDERLTKMGFLLGTPRYMAPEQCLDASVGPGADLYSLGVVMFEMLAGYAPYSATNIGEVLALHLDGDIPAPPPSGGLENTVAWLLQKRPNERPQDAAALIASLDRLSGLPTEPAMRSPEAPHISERDRSTQAIERPRVKSAAPSPPTPSEISLIVQIEEPVEWSARDQSASASSPRLDASNPLLAEPELPMVVRTRKDSGRG